MITPAFNSIAAGQVLPRLAFDFTTAALDSRIAFTRANATATCVNASGNVETVAADTPRFDYNPTTLAARGLLIEGARTNAVPNSSDFTVADYATTNAAVLGSSVLSPDGVNTAQKIAPNTGIGGYIIKNSQAFTSGVTYTESIFLKKGEVSYVSYYTRLVSATYIRVNVNLNTGAIAGNSNPAALSASITPYKDGWYRLVLTGTSTATSNRVCAYIQGTDSTFTGYIGNGSDGYHQWGLQVEEGAFVSSFIPTSGGTATRNADVATITGANFSSFWKDTQGGIAVRALPSTVSGTRPLIQFDDATADNLIALRGNTTNPELYIKATTDQAQIDAGTIAANTAYRLAGSWATDACAASINSGAPVLDGVATIPAVTQARLGSDGTNYLNGHLQSIEYFDRQVTPAELQALSSQIGYRSMIRSLINPVL